MKKTLCLLLAVVFLLSGCGGRAAQPQPSAAVAPAPVSAAPEVPVQSPETLTEPENNPSDSSPEPSAEPSVMIWLEHTLRETMDPAEGNERILSFSWDSVQVSAKENPAAAQRITETMALLQDLWYTGSGEEGSYGYNAMLEQAEDNFSIAREYGGPVELSSSRTVTAIRADESICVFLVNEYVYLGGAHGSYAPEALCFDMHSGDLLSLEDLSSDPELLCSRLLDAMLRLAEEDAEGYYTEHLSLTEPENYPAAFAGLLRDGSWYPGADGFHVFSGLYELGPYASGITEFLIPYEKLGEALDTRWLPAETADETSFSITVPGDTATAVVGSVVIGDGGEACLLISEEEARDVSLWSCGFSGRFYPERQLFYCDRLRNAALQVALLFPGDLPDTMLRYRDASGEHELLLTLSGKDGSLQLVKND